MKENLSFYTLSKYIAYREEKAHGISKLKEHLPRL